MNLLLFDLEVKILNFWMILKLDKVEMLLILEEEKSKENKMERGPFPTNTLQLLYPTQNPIANPPPII